MSIRILHADIHVIDLETRLPFRYGIATMTRTPHFFVRVQAEVNGTIAQGIAADHLPPKWFTKVPDRPFDDEIAEMSSVIQNAVATSRGLQAETVFDLWRTLYDLQANWGREQGLPPLLTNFGTSLVERALIEAVCKATETNFASAVRENHLGIRLDELDAELSAESLAEFLPREPLRELTIRRTLGIADPLTDEEIGPDDLIQDGLPQSLAGLIRQYGLRHFKIKVAGKAEEDLNRLAAFFSVLADCDVHDFRYTIDGNELFHSLEEFREYWEVISAEPNLSASPSRLLFVEQPFHRDIALDAEKLSELNNWADRPSIIIDESDAELESFPVALSLGYAGTSHKNCKGVIKSLLNYCRLEHRRRLTGNRDAFVMSVEDLVNIGPVALPQDLAVAATLGMTSVERNGHHYFKGLSAFPSAVQQQAFNAHSDLYAKTENGFPAVRIEAGVMQVGSVVDSPFGVGFELDVSQFQPVTEWESALPKT
jgi:hypothetical protein